MGYGYYNLIGSKFGMKDMESFGLNKCKLLWNYKQNVEILWNKLPTSKKSSKTTPKNYRNETLFAGTFS